VKALGHRNSVLNAQKCKNPDELKAVFPSLDNFKYEDKLWGVGVGGNILRVVAAIQFVKWINTI
jgi:mRNA interferase HigB